VDLEPAEIRVLGCLLEKQRTTPDAYPLTLNALRAACNQTTNRDPVVSYDDETIRQALHKLGRRRWTRLTSGHSSRAAKYRHLLAEELRLEVDEQAILAVLALRGPQTPGELKARTERLHDFADMAAVEAAVDKLVGRGMAVRLERRPGQKEARYAHLLGDEIEAEATAPPPRAEPVATRPPPLEPVSPDGAAADLEPRLARLEDEVAELRGQLAALRAELGVE
jgi:uncharacterized protein YceH (UPF0502 family)